jgi:hypothetical protein
VHCTFENRKVLDATGHRNQDPEHNAPAPEPPWLRSAELFIFEDIIAVDRALFQPLEPSYVLRALVLMTDLASRSSNSIDA